MNKQQADNIITEYMKKIYGFAVKKSFSYGEAEELAADIVKEVYLSLLGSDEIANLDGYVWRISEHAYSKYVSSKKRHEGVSIDGIALPFYDEYSFESDNREDILRLRREIAFLTEQRREIVYLFYYENRSISYIAEKTSLSEGTVKWHLNKARNELKEGFSMERRIGKLGLHPVTSTCMGHGGNPGRNGRDTSYYLGDKFALNICYSVYFEPKTKEEIAEELGVTPVYIEEKIEFLEGNGFLVPQPGGKYTTYVRFSPQTYSLEEEEEKLKKQLEAALVIARDYAPKVREAIKDVEVYIPNGNRELFEAAAIFYAIRNKCALTTGKRIDSKYYIKTQDGGEFIANVDLARTRSDPEYKATLSLPNYWACGDMTRWSYKYPAVYSWSVDTRYDSRKGAWSNNLTADYEYLYEVISGMISENAATAEKFERLRERDFLTEDGKPNIMIIKGSFDDFSAKLPKLDEDIKKEFVNFALETAMVEAKKYPPQMHDLVVNSSVNSFIGSTVALMALDNLYATGAFRPLEKEEKVAANLLMFSDILP